MRVLYSTAMLFAVASSVLAADATSTTEGPRPQANSSTNQALQCYISDWRGQPIWYSLDEILNRSWKSKDGRTISLLQQEVVKVSLPDLSEILVVRFGQADSNRTVCLDFYAKGSKLVQENYLLLCHETHCPPFNTRATLKEQDKRTFFTISGESLDKTTHHQYDYELNSKWQMVESFSHFRWKAH